MSGPFDGSPASHQVLAVLDQLPIGVIAVRVADGSVVHVNAAAQALLGGPGPAGLDLATLFRRLVPGDDRRRALLASLSASDVVFDVVTSPPYTIQRWDGTVRVIRTTVAQPTSQGLTWITITDETGADDARPDLEKLVWMLAGDKPDSTAQLPDPETGLVPDLTVINRSGELLYTLGRRVLDDLTHELRDLLKTSAMVIEADGTVALQHHQSQWCRLVVAASRDLCKTDDDAVAVASGQWLCHESCGVGCLQGGVTQDQALDATCHAGIQIHAQPIRVSGRVVGAISIAHGSPPTAASVLQPLAERLGVDPDQLRRAAAAYVPRPQVVVALAKRRLTNSTRLIASMLESRRAEAELRGRLKELRCLHGISHILSQDDLSSPAIFSRAVRQLPPALRWPTSALARIRYRKLVCTTGDLSRAVATLSHDIQVHGETVGAVEVAYVDRRPPADIGPFLREENDLLRTLAQRLGHAMERAEGRLLMGTVVDGSPVAIYSTDPDGLVTSWNAAAETVFGLAKQEILGLPAPWVPVDDQEFSGRVGTAGRVVQDVVTLRKDGSTLLCKMSAAVLLDTAGEPHGFVIVAEDLTVQRQQQERIERLERETRTSRRLESIGRLAGGVAHDFNNQLTVINSYARLASDSLHERDPLREDLGYILDAGEQAAVLTRQLLAFSSRQALDPVVLDLNAVVQRLDRMLRRIIGEDIDLHTNLGPDLGRVRADPAQVEQMLMNLVMNAREALPGGGTVTIATANRQLQAGEGAALAGLAAGPVVVLSIADDGVGMSEEVLQHVFEPFYSTKSDGRGTGLGLAAVYGLVKQSGGHISVQSQHGQGTNMEIYLPRVDAELDVERLPRFHHTSVPAKGETVLLVEDEDAVRELTSRILSTAGYHVLSAANGGEALLLLEQAQDTVDMVLTDVVMPQMNGAELVAHLRSKRPGLRALFMSGYSADVLSQGNELLDAIKLVPKPFRPDQLLDGVRQTLDGQAANLAGLGDV